MTPPSTLAHPQVGTLERELHLNQVSAPCIIHLGPRLRIEAWQALGADKVLLQAISKGIKSPITQIPAPCFKDLPQEDAQKLLPTISDYINRGAIRLLTPEEYEKTKYWVPVFPVTKRDSTEVRMITNLRALNECQLNRHHKAES